MFSSKNYTIQPYYDGAMAWWITNERPWPNYNAGDVIPLSDELKIQFRFYKQTIHLFDTVKEEYNLLHSEKIITIHPSELRNEDTASIMQSPSMRMIKQIIDTEIPSSEKSVRLEVEEGILRIVQNPSTPFLVPPNHRIFVNAIDGIKILHDASEKSSKRRVHDHLEAARCSTCPICMDEIKLNKPSRLPCLHLFHHWCVAKWLEIKHECPYCRSPVPHEFVTWF
ncbi:uncharacterized protein LOC133710424 [Rosa rugosa]|uniref:uncharacterized protein LOC133710424 n=1 Tax=Rosa rugosa TaxID=74645 RepID=UPI002B4089AB|nr:uncharacterized protein LOC133710424 [Rosa rugosa]